MEFQFVYFIIINVIAFVVYGYDKWTAQKGKRRIPEKTLLGLACVGGSLGAFYGMLFFRHKIRKIKFYLGVPIIFLIHIGIIAYIYC